MRSYSPLLHQRSELAKANISSQVCIIADALLNLNGNCHQPQIRFNIDNVKCRLHMTHLNLNDVQRLLQLDAAHPYFESREELLEFTVDGVSVKAVISYGWRCETIKLVEPFHVDGAEYGLGFEPMLIAIGASFEARKKSLETQGFTVRDYWLQEAKRLYQLHTIYLRSKAAILIEQDQLSKQFEDEQAMLWYKFTIAREQFRLCRSALRTRLRERLISQREYQEKLVDFRSDAVMKNREYQSLRDQVDRELHEIKMNFIKREL